MTDSQNFIRAQALYKAGYQNEHNDLLSWEDEVWAAKTFYNEKCLSSTDSPLNDEEAEAMLLAYKELLNRKDTQTQTEDKDFISSIISFILFILFIVVWLGIRFAKLLIKTYKDSKIIDALDLRNNTAELEEKCEAYREQLKDWKTCPRNLKALAGTTGYMSAAGMVYLIMALFIILSYALQSQCLLVAPFLIIFMIQIALGLALFARHKLSAGILFLVQTVYGVLVMTFGILVPNQRSPYYFMLRNINFQNGVSMNGLILIGIFLAISVVFAIYFILNFKNKVIEITIFASYVICYLYAYLNTEIAFKLEFRSKMLTAENIFPSLSLIQFAWFVIIYLMCKGKKKIKK